MMYGFFPSSVYLY